ncbi:MAG: hypothetical protein AAF810_11885 [Cyanobacteria bacterium P01_D01_bin.36]
MDEWLKQLQADLHEVAKDSSDWFAEVSKQSNEMIDAVVEASVSALQGMDDVMTPALEELGEQMDEALDASVVFVEQQLTPWVEKTSAPITHTVTPWLQNHPACIGCEHYHGTAYGEEMLVCGMHPYGPDDRNCADWESVWETGNVA